MTPGEISQATALTTGSVTAVLDRLEKGGFVRRERDPADRRRVAVKLAPDRRRQIAAIFQPMLRRAAEMYSALSEAELSAILRFLRTAIPMLHRETAKLRPGVAMAAWVKDFPGELSAPLGSVKRGRLLVRTGAAQLCVRADPSASTLYRAHFQGRAPLVRANGGSVSIIYSRSRAIEGKTCGAEVGLNGSIPWDIELRGGVSRLTADLAQLSLQSLNVSDGASDVAMKLPPPVGTIRVVFAGGVSRLRLQRPCGVPARLQLNGEAHQLGFDAHRLGAVGGETRLESANYSSSEDRYEISVLGGANELSVEECDALGAGAGTYEQHASP
jgi:hypothetical protein